MSWLVIKFSKLNLVILLHDILFQMGLFTSQGDVSETVSTFHESSSLVKPLKKSLLSLQDVSDIFFDNDYM